MEISSRLIQQAFKGVSKGRTHQELDASLKELANEALNDILFAVKARLIDNKIHHIISSVKNRLKDEKDVYFSDFTKILATVHSYFDRAIRQADINSLLVYLNANCYLLIDIKYFAQQVNITDEENQKLSEQIDKLLSAITLQVNLPSDAPYSERTLFDRAEDGFKEQNIEKIYELILAIERSNKGFYISFLLENLIYFFLKINKSKFLMHIAKLNHPQQNVFYFQSFPKEDIITLLHENSITNKWTLLELIRQLIERDNRNDQLDLATGRAMINAIRALYRSDYHIYKQSISFFHCSKSFNYALGQQLDDVEVQRIAEIFEQQLPFDQYSNYLEHRTLLLDQLTLNLAQEKYMVVLSTVFDKWNKLYQSLKDSRAYLNSLLLSDFGNFIIHWYKESFTDEQIIFSIDENINRLFWIDLEWFPTSSMQVTYFHLYLTQLYFLSYAFANKGLHDEELSALILNFEANAIITSRFLNSDSTIIDTIKRNLNGETILG